MKVPKRNNTLKAARSRLRPTLRAIRGARPCSVTGLLPVWRGRGDAMSSVRLRLHRLIARHWGPLVHHQGQTCPVGFLRYSLISRGLGGRGAIRLVSALSGRLPAHQCRESTASVRSKSIQRARGWDGRWRISSSRTRGAIEPRPSNRRSAVSSPYRGFTSPLVPRISPSDRTGDESGAL